jgi:hypothetical protein
MNNQNHINDDQLIEATRGITSRHENIPPTPRDTMAVLRQSWAQPASAPVYFLSGWRFAFALAALLIIGATLWWIKPGPSPVIATNDVEFELFWEEVNETLAWLDEDDAWM